MKENIILTSLKKDLQKFTLSIAKGLTIPFRENPSTERYNTDQNEELNAHDLFSRFTADIIKEDVEFLRQSDASMVIKVRSDHQL